MKREKGEYGYRDHNRRVRLFITLLLAAGILAQLAWRYATDNEALKNILTVMAILTVLPMANMASPLLASWRYKTPASSFYDRVSSYEKQAMILYDLIVTTKEQIIPLDGVAVHPSGVYGYCPAAKVDSKKGEKDIGAILSANRVPGSVKIIQDEKSFFRRLDSLKPASEYEDDGTVAYIAQILKNISM